MSDLASKLEHLAGRHVLCIGDIMLDRYIYGQVERVSPEAPIPVLHTQRETATLGGSGNVVRNVVALDGIIATIGMVGDDTAGADLKAALQSIGVSPDHLVADPTRPTTQKTRFVASGQQLLRADQEKVGPASAEIEARLLTALRTCLLACDTVILSDYAKGVLTPSVTTAAIDLAHAAGKTVIVDPKGRDFSRYRGAHFLTPNRKELTDASGRAIATVQDAEDAARGLMQTCGIGAMLVKLGSDGVCLVTADAPARHFHTKAREVFDVSGAGDTVAATFALALAGGLNPTDAAELANIAGSVVVGKVGTATVTRDDIERELIRGAAAENEVKLAGLATAVDTVEKWRRQGLKVGFTNGCFDLLHPGHIALLRQARAACDRLVVGLNSDASVQRLKGPTRPVQSEAARGTVLASLADVSQVVIFGEDTPLELIRALRPDILVKGADYQRAQVVGGDLVESWGGKVVLADLVEGQSTTGTIARMAR